MEVKKMFEEINALFDVAVMSGVSEFVGLLLLCAKIFSAVWVLKTLFGVFTKKGK